MDYSCMSHSGLMSFQPSYTCALLSSASTSANQEQHGIFKFNCFKKVKDVFMYHHMHFTVLLQHTQHLQDTIA